MTQPINRQSLTELLLGGTRSGQCIVGEDCIAAAIQPGCTEPKRFTLDGDDALERHLASVCETVGAEVRSLIPAGRLEGVLLGGGYGRGEGGVLRSPTGDRPYNDLEFYVFVRGHSVWVEHRFRAALHELGRRLSPQAGLEVEFKALPLAKLRSAEPSMFYYDLTLGHRWVIGDSSLLEGCQRLTDSAEIPLHEATRLLMNRCTGLLFSAERLRRENFGPEESDYVGRNLAKAGLALGDVVLTAFHQYHWSCRERHRRLLSLKNWDEFPSWEALCLHHREGVAFKLHPTCSKADRGELERQHRELLGLARELWLWLESRRLGIAFANVGEYVRSPVDKCPESPWWRNRLVNAMNFGLHTLAHPTAGQYPRQRLLHSLGLLLWDDLRANDPVRLRFLRNELRTDATDFFGWMNAYERLWHRFN